MRSSITGHWASKITGHWASKTTSPARPRGQSSSSFTFGVVLRLADRYQRSEDTACALKLQGTPNEPRSTGSSSYRRAIASIRRRVRRNPCPLASPHTRATYKKYSYPLVNNGIRQRSAPAPLPPRFWPGRQTSSGTPTSARRDATASQSLRGYGLTSEGMWFRPTRSTRRCSVSSRIACHRLRVQQHRARIGQLRMIINND